MNHPNKHILKRIAEKEMLEHDFDPDFSKKIFKELEKIENQAENDFSNLKDLRQLLWCSIDNDDSLDLDQLTTAEFISTKVTKIYIAVADVDSLVPLNSQIDKRAKHNTTSIYTSGGIFPMLPDKLSTDLTSLNFEKDRPAIVIEMDVDSNGLISNSNIYRALVKNHAKLAYDSVAEWLDKKTNIEAPAFDENMKSCILLQHKVAELLRTKRYDKGALDLETIEARAIFIDDAIRDLKVEHQNSAKKLIEDFMIAANGVTALFLKQHELPSFRRIVRSPKRWERIREIAIEHGFKLPEEPDGISLSKFLEKQKKESPISFPDISLSIVKLMGRGEYEIEFINAKTVGHFGLAVRDYTHSTAPNRRYPDLVTQRMLKATLSGETQPYSDTELVELAKYCTEKEDDASKVERLVAKSAAAMLLATHIGEIFDAICTGAADKGTWVRIFTPPAEGKLVKGALGVEVGQTLKVKLVHTDFEKGFIDFERSY